MNSLPKAPPTLGSSSNASTEREASPSIPQKQRCCVWVFYLPRPLQVDGDDLEAIAAELAGPAAALTDPLQQALLVRVPDGAVAAARVHQVALNTTDRDRASISL